MTIAMLVSFEHREPLRDRRSVFRSSLEIDHHEHGRYPIHAASTDRNRPGRHEETRRMNIFKFLNRLNLPLE